MKTKYDELTLMHNLFGVILPTERYEHIYNKGDYLIPPVTTLYDDTIDKDAVQTEVHQAEGKHEAKQNERQLLKQPIILARTSSTAYMMKFLQ